MLKGRSGIKRALILWLLLSISIWIFVLAPRAGAISEFTVTSLCSSFYLVLIFPITCILFTTISIIGWATFLKPFPWEDYLFPSLLIYIVIGIGICLINKNSIPWVRNYQTAASAILIISITVLNTFVTWIQVHQPLSDHGAKVRILITQTRISKIQKSIANYTGIYHRSPVSLDDLTICSSASPTDCSYLLNTEDLKDGWGYELSYKIKYKIISLGGDGIEGGKMNNADIIVESEWVGN